MLCFLALAAVSISEVITTSIKHHCLKKIHEIKEFLLTSRRKDARSVKNQGEQRLQWLIEGHGGGTLCSCTRMKLTTRAWQTAASTTPEKRTAPEGRQSRFAVAAVEGRRRRKVWSESELVGLRWVRRKMDEGAV
ncbi:Ribosomal protein L38e [Sesbania bispinosa]|nr:Ribosomal protein L38e [Sesbania bispinosa]